MDDRYKHPVDEKKVHFKVNLLGSKKQKSKWVILIIVLSFILSISMSLVSSSILQNVNIFVAFLVVLVIILISIIFDLVGTAVTAADEAPFHSMASRKLYGARQAIRLVRNADKVSNFCNDVVGDICGIISGTASAYIIISFVKSSKDSETTIAGLVITGLVAAMTVGGKAFGKTIAIQNSNYIICLDYQYFTNRP